MSRKNLIYVAIALWLAAYATSFILTQTLEPTGDGFTRGLNRLEAFFKWQILAAIIAVVTWVLGNAFEKGSVTRRLSRAPAILAVALLVLVVGIIVVANMNKPAPEPYRPPGQATAPAQPVP